MKKTKTVEPITPAKNIVSIPIESVSTSIIVAVEYVCDRIPIKSFFVESVENSFPYNMIFLFCLFIDFECFYFENW